MSEGRILWIVIVVVVVGFAAAAIYRALPAGGQQADAGDRVDVALRFISTRARNEDAKPDEPAVHEATGTELVDVPGDGDPFMLHPGEFVLGSTLERIASR